MELVFIIVILIYSMGVLLAAFAFSEKSKLSEDVNVYPRLYFSLIVVFRNEAANLPKLFRAIEAQDYPEDFFEVILINDFSTDQSHELAFGWIKKGSNRLLFESDSTLHPSPKKAGFLKGLQQASSKNILRTDADCWFSDYWLSSWNDHLHQNRNSGLAGGPVFTEAKGLFGAWANIESLVLALFTRFGFRMRKPFMFNAANSFMKIDDFPLDPFKDDGGKISGDDEALLQNISQKKISFNCSKSSQVFSNAPDRWNDFLNQKLRWSGKWEMDLKKVETWIPLILVTFYTFYFAMFILVFRSLIPWVLFVQLILIKGISDLLLLLKARILFGKKFTVFEFIMFECLFGFYTLFIGVISRFRGHTWKGRSFSSNE